MTGTKRGRRPETARRAVERTAPGGGRRARAMPGRAAIAALAAAALAAFGFGHEASAHHSDPVLSIAEVTDTSITVRWTSAGAENVWMYSVQAVKTEDLAPGGQWPPPGDPRLTDKTKDPYTNGLDLKLDWLEPGTRYAVRLQVHYGALSGIPSGHDMIEYTPALCATTGTAGQPGQASCDPPLPIGAALDASARAGLRAALRTGLAEIARAVLGGAADAIGGRFASAGGAEAPVPWAMWGRGDLRRFGVERGAVRHDGALRTGWLGVDARAGDDVLFGVAFSRTAADTEYRSAAAGGALDASMTALWPYLRVAGERGEMLQFMLGIGAGEAEFRPAGPAGERADLSLSVARIEAGLPVARRGGLALSLAGDFGLAHIGTDASSQAIAGLEAEVWRLSGGFEIRYDEIRAGAGGYRFAPFATLALRRDGGDGVEGTGVEIGGGLALAAPGSRFGVDLRARFLALRDAGRDEDWGAGLRMGFVPDAAGRGLSFSLGSEQGVPDAGALDGGNVFAAGAGGAGQGSLTARAGYGFGLGSWAGVLTPGFEVALGKQGERQYGAGVEFRCSGAFRAALTADRIESGQRQADKRIGLEARLSF